MGLISVIAGIAMCIYGYMENKDTIAVMENLAEGGGGKPGGTYIFIGVVLIILGVILAGRSSKKSNGNNTGNDGTNSAQ